MEEKAWYWMAFDKKKYEENFLDISSSSNDGKESISIKKLNFYYVKWRKRQLRIKKWKESILNIIFWMMKMNVMFRLNDNGIEWKIVIDEIMYYKKKT